MNVSDAHRIARDALDLRGLSPWIIRWEDGWVRRAGRCDPNTKTIYLSVPFVTVNDEREVREIIYHEIAHAMVPWDSHGPVWQRVARLLGCSGREQPRLRLPPLRRGGSRRALTTTTARV